MVDQKKNRNEKKVTAMTGRRPLGKGGPVAVKLETEKDHVLAP